MDEKYMNEKQVSEMIGRALPTLRNDRFLRRGLPYTKMGRSVRYRYQDVIDYMTSRRIATGEGK